jgi:hypothetical protein
MPIAPRFGRKGFMSGSGSLPPPKWDTSLVGRSLKAVARRVPLAAAIFGMLFEPPRPESDDRSVFYKQERK